MNNKRLTISKSRRFGFTLVELLVVITIISILVAISTVSYTNAQHKARDGKIKSDLKSIQNALELYYQKNGKYPATGASGKIRCNVGAATDISWGGNFTCNSITYMNPLPKDPSFTPASGQDYYYNSGGINTYLMSARLENTNDTENTLNPNYALNPTLPCTPTGGRSYCVIQP